MFKSTLITAGAALALTAASAFAAQSSSNAKNGLSLDTANGTEEGIDIPEPQDDCAGDTDADQLIDVNDISRVYNNWGLRCAQGCGSLSGDVNGDGRVDVMDLLAVVTNWGACQTDVPDTPDPEPKSDQFVDDFGDGSPTGDQIQDANSAGGDPADDLDKSDQFADDFSDGSPDADDSISAANPDDDKDLSEEVGP